MGSRTRKSRRAMAFGCLVIPMFACGGSSTSDFGASGAGGATDGAAGSSTAVGSAGSTSQGGSSAGGASGPSGGSGGGTTGGSGGNGGSTGGVNRDSGRDVTIDGNGGSRAGAGGSNQPDASTQDSPMEVCISLAGSCEFSSECCSHYCKAETHECTAPERCPMPCGPGTYCSPTFGAGPNTCEPAPSPVCQGNGAMARCNRCIVSNCPAEVVYCSCSKECFSRSSGCLPTCGLSFAGFAECIDARCKDECAN
jgi:hypothetical protein